MIVGMASSFLSFSLVRLHAWLGVWGWIRQGDVKAPEGKAGWMARWTSTWERAKHVHLESRGSL